MKPAMRTGSLAALALAVLTAWTAAAQTTAQGVVFHDRDADGTLDAGEEGIEGVCVSNGRDVARTDAEGRWSLPAGDDTIFFVVKPSDWAVPVDGDNVPRFYYIHKPAGSPKLEKAGVAPTGPLPESIDFGLRPVPEPRRFTAVFFADPQARGLEQVGYIAHDVVPELVGTDAGFGVTLGDIVADDPELCTEINAVVGRIGIPWYSLPGNHDTNRDTRDDRYSDETLERIYGPGTYAFEYGGAAFVALDSVFVKPDRGYEGRFTADQLAFVRNYLAAVAPEKLVVLMMHIPLPACANRNEMLALLESRPHAFSISGHAHEQSHRFLGEAQGWRGAEPHHHYVAGAVSGCWWCGAIDEAGIPHATMNDGVPNGYNLLDVDGNTYKLRFKAARRPADYQMNVYLPDEIAQAQAGSTELLVNVFAGSERSKVEYRIGDDGAWLPLEQTTGRDPACQRMYEQSAAFTPEMEEQLGCKMDEPSRTSHLWKGMLPAELPSGTHRVTVRATDMFGQTCEAHRIIRVR